MIALLETIRRNEVLFVFGLVMAAGGVVTGMLAFTTSTQVMGINAFIKPMKFFISVAIFVWTMAYFMTFLDDQRQVSIYSWIAVVGLGYELLAITWQAANGKLSHFNIQTPFDQAVFTSMGIVITIVVGWTGYIDYLFFKQSSFTIDPTLVASIRYGILIAVVFAFEGGVMGSLLRHTVGAEDGGQGLPVLNWSTRHGDLRVAHFFGLHAMQILPLVAIAICKTEQHVIVAAVVYFVVVTASMIQAFLGKPLIGW